MNSNILQSELTTGDHFDVFRFADIDSSAVDSLLQRYGLILNHVNSEDDIPGSYWGDEEAGLITNQLLVRADTPLHSILHETCHYVCMDQARRDGVHTNAGGDYDEENAVCYLQILLSDYLSPFSHHRMFKDMDHWGYTFRLGSAQKWFEMDAEDARALLLEWKLIDTGNHVTFNLRK